MSEPKSRRIPKRIWFIVATVLIVVLAFSMEENRLLALFVMLPVLLGFFLFLFFRKFKQYQKSPQWLWLIFGNSLVFLFVCSLVLVTGEVYFRFIYDTSDSFGTTKTNVRWLERHFQKNLMGFRDSAEYNNIILLGKRRVTFIGDSFTAGNGVPNVEDRFVNVIRRKNPNWEVHATADSGWNTGVQLLFLTDMQVAGYQSDLVVLVYCMNDIEDIDSKWKRSLEQLYPASEPGFFFQHSYFLNTLYFRWKKARDPEVLNYYHFLLKLYKGPIWEQQKQRLRLLREKVHSQNGQLMVVTFPFLHTLGPDYEYRPVHKLLDDHWRELDVPHLDLLSIYKSISPDEIVVNSHDAHPNERAHKMAAEAITVFLEKHLKN